MNKLKKKALITSGIQHRLDEYSHILRLGSWCNSSARALNSSADENVTTFNYPIKNKGDIIAHGLSASKCVKEIELILFEALENFHGLSFNEKQWRVLLGPWLIKSVDVIYERHLCLSKCAEEEEFDVVVAEPPLFGDVFSEDSDAFSDNCKRDEWNYRIYNRIIRCQTGDSPRMWQTEVPDKIDEPTEKEEKTKLGFWPLRVKLNLLFPFIRSIAISIIMFIGSFTLVKNLSVVFLSPYVSRWDLIRLNFRFNGRPWLNFYTESEAKELQKNYKYDSKQRNLFSKTLKNLWDNSEASQIKIIYLQLLPEILPAVFLESLPNLLNVAKQSGSLPERPKYVVTAIEIYKNELVKAWLALHLNEIRLVIRQHGGEYFTGAYVPNERLELSLADVYLTGGLEGSNKCNLVSYGNPFSVQQKVRCTGDKIVCVLRPIPKYATSLQSSVARLSGEAEGYIKFILSFIESLPIFLREKIVIRSGQKGINEEGYINVKKRLLEADSDLRFIDDISFDAVKRASRVMVCFYNGTTFLECMSQGLPTLLVSDPDFDPIRESVASYYKRLEASGIYHKRGKAAAEQIEKIYKEPHTWLKKAKTSTAVEQFVKGFAMPIVSHYDSLTSVIEADQKRSEKYERITL